MPVMNINNIRQLFFKLIKTLVSQLKVNNTFLIKIGTA